MSVTVTAEARTIPAGFGEQMCTEAVVAAQGAFLDACREDLAYATKRWQLLRQYKESRFLRGQVGR
ncbi:hypothetical protein [Streptomyces sp. NPDC001312]|uniref:hypothetical protein n=1 Tax=Streptomyces sp. NPDC001312 TaxID=3364561 RepID=UPI003683DB16